MQPLISKALLFLALVYASTIQAQQPPDRVMRGIISQFVSGGGGKTSVTLVNLAATPNLVTVNFKANDGLPLVVPLTIEEDIFSINRVSSRVTSVIAPFATLVISSEWPDQTESYGGWVEVLSAARVAGFATLSAPNEQGDESETTTSMETGFLSGLIFPFDNTEDYATLVTLINPNAVGVMARIVMRDTLGVQIESRTYEVTSGGRISIDLHARFAHGRGQRGSVEIQNGNAGPMTGLATRVNSSGASTSLPVIAIAAR